MKKDQNGFTLVELLVVISIIAILITVLVPVILDVQKKARRTACQANLKKIFEAVKAYTTKSLEEGGGDGLVPYEQGSSDPAAHLQLLVKSGMIQEPTMLKCPGGSGPIARLDENQDPTFDLTANTKTCYYTWTKQEGLAEEHPKPAVVPLTGDRWSRETAGTGYSNNHGGGRNILFLSGRIEWMSTKKLQQKDILNKLHQ